VRQRTRGSHGNAKARDLSFVVLNNRRSEEDYGGPIPLWSSHVAEALHHFKAQSSLHVPSAVILSVFAFFFHSVYLSRILGNTPIISLNNLILLVFVLDICMFSVRQEFKFCALVRII
jgi:ABC-type polysaccharide transport system permease subunit